ncbi:hypothetical protein F4782DRAFT_516597 [Xylaria castorea]|nr:hypothetical protein F4782DRAFT_516597 [Xylaria castorea]
MAGALSLILRFCLSPSICSREKLPPQKCPSAHSVLDTLHIHRHTHVIKGVLHHCNPPTRLAGQSTLPTLLSRMHLRFLRSLIEWLTLASIICHCHINDLHWA